MVTFLSLTALVPFSMADATPASALLNSDSVTISSATAITPTEILLQSRQDFLMSLYDAQIALHNKQAEQGKKYVEAAFRLLNKMDNADKQTGFRTDKALYNTLRRVVEFDIGTLFTPERAVIPITNQHLTSNKLYQAINIEKLEEGTIKEATIRYIAFDVDPAPFRDELNDALKAINEGDLYSAQYDLLQIQRDMLDDVNTDIPPVLQARDNVALTRFLLAHQEYGAALETLDVVEEAVDDLNRTVEPQLIKRAKEEITKLRAYANKRDTNEDALINIDFDALWD